MLCKQNSRYKSLPNVDVMYTEIQHVKKTGTVGAVSVETYKILSQ
jgi:hypothetical protein